MKGKIKTKKLTTTLLITVLLISTIAGLAMPTVLAATPVTADYVFETSGAVIAEWALDPATGGTFGYVAKLNIPSAAPASNFAYIHVYPDLSTPITISTLAVDVQTLDFDYYLSSAGNQQIPDVMFTFESVTGTGWVEVTLYALSSVTHWDATTDTWTHANNADITTTTVHANSNGFEDDGDQIDAGQGTTWTLAQVLADFSSDYDDWVLTKITPQLGWGGNEIVSYVDNIEIAGVTYDLEPTTLTVDTTYDIAISTSPNQHAGSPVWLQDVDGSTFLGNDVLDSTGSLSLYNIIPLYSGNNSIYDPLNAYSSGTKFMIAWIGAVSGTATGGSATTTVDTARVEVNDAWNDWYILFTSGSNEGELLSISDFDATSDTITHDGPSNGVVAGDQYIIVQRRIDLFVEPVQSYTVDVTPTSMDVHEGTATYTVTVTNTTGPVKDAYVTALFWDNEANQINDENTINLKTIRIQTLTDGTARFDVEAPDVAGTIMVFAGRDIDETPDKIYDQWGYMTIPVESELFLDITVTPESYLKDIAGDLTIELGNKDATKDILEASSQTNAVNITLEGSDMTGTVVTGGTYFTVDYIDKYDGADWTQDDTTDPSFTSVEILRIVGNTDGHDFGTADQADVTITGFVSAEVGDITVTACSDIGGVDGGAVETIDDPGPVDGGADYMETAAETITVSTPDPLNIVKVGTTPDPLKVEFAGLPDETFKALSTATKIDLKVYDAEGNEFDDSTTDYILTEADFTLTGVDFAKDPDISYETTKWEITIYPLESGNITVSVTDGTDTASTEYKIYGLKDSVSPDQFTNTTAYYDVNVTLTTFEGLPVSTAQVQLQQNAVVLTQHLKAGDEPAYRAGVRAGDPAGLYRFFNVTAEQVGTEWDNAIQVVAGIDLGATIGDYTQAADNFGGETITVSYDILDVSLDRGNVTALIDQDVEITVLEGTTPIEDATVYVDGCGYINEALSGTTSSLGELTFSFDGQTGTIPGTITIRAETSDKTKTGSTTLTVLRPDFMLYNLTVNDHTTTVVTAGLDAYIYNATILDGDENLVLTTDTTILVIEGTNLGLYFNASSEQTDLVTDGAVVDSSKLLLAPEGYAITEIPKGSTAKTAYTAYELFEFTVCDEEDSTTTYPETIPDTDANLLNVYNLTISLPIVSNSTGQGFPITYTAYVGQSQNFYVKIQDADGVLVEGATVEIITGGTAPSGDTDSAGETTITWEPTATGTYKLRLNDELNIGTITVESYTAPQLVLDYSPETVYENDVVTLTVTADAEPVGGVSVDVVDPYGETYSRTTTSVGTCTFTADVMGDWTVYASKTDYTDADPVTITVLELAPITEISLSEGWNLVSLPLIPYNSSIESVLAGVEGIESVWTYDAGIWYTYSPGAPSDLNTMVDGKGYWISITASATLTVNGTEMPEDPLALPPAYPVVEGWNLMGFKSTSTRTMGNYLLGVDYVRVYEYVDGYNSLSAGDDMMPGRGYWISVSEAGTIYP